MDPILFPSFPGFESEHGFGCRLETPPSLVETLTASEVDSILGSDRDAAVERTAALVGERLNVLRDRDSPPNVVIVSLPMTVKRRAGDGRAQRPKQKRTAGRHRNASRQLLLAFFDEPTPEPPPRSRTLHRALKAEGMRHSLPTQVAWPTTFVSGEGRQDDATRAWNFCTALYYKAGGVPWRATGLSKNTLYVGISFFRALDAPNLLQTSMAQTFSDRGEGVVLRGANFEWDIKRQGAPQLPRDAAQKLIGEAVKHYHLHHRQLPARVVVHKSARFGDEELDGFAAGLTDVPYADFLAVSKSDIRFLRVGEEPPIRGTCVTMDPRRHVIYTRGYVPYLKLYPGLRIPRPFQVVHARGESPIQELLAEFLALTRLNWNSADFAAAEPITLGFAHKVGLILAELPPEIDPQPSFRFYM